jgi:hypothetical protein
MLYAYMYTELGAEVAFCYCALASGMAMGGVLAAGAGGGVYVARCQMTAAAIVVMCHWSLWRTRTRMHILLITDHNFSCMRVCTTKTTATLSASFFLFF